MARLLLDSRSNPRAGFIKKIIQNNSIENLKILVDRNTNLNSLNYGQTILHLCCIPAKKAPPEESFDTERCQLIRFLIAKGANVNAKNGHGDTPLALALRKEYFAVVKFLVLNYDVDINFRDDDGRAPLHNLTRNHRFHIEDKNLLLRFLELGFNINTQDNNGNSILHFACIFQEAGCIQFLIRNGANVNLKNRFNYSPLHLVLPFIITRHHGWKSTVDRPEASVMQVTEALLRYNADVKGDVGKYTPIMRAHRYLAIIKFLVDNNADVNARCRENETVLHIACKIGVVDVVKLLLENGADSNAIDTEGCTPILRATNLPVVKCLLDWNADVYVQNKKGETLLHCVSVTGSVDAIRFVLNRYVDMIYMNDKSGRTALYSAATRIQPKIYETLLNYGVDPQKRNERGFLAYCILSQYEFMEQVFNPTDKHIIKMKCVGRIYKDGGRSNESVRFDVNDFEAECNEEIEAMKTTKVGDNNTTLYGLLMNGYRGVIANIFGYEELITILENDEYRKKFPLYIDMVLARVAESGMRRKLLKTAEKYVLTGSLKNLPYDCVCNIFGYLNVREIKLFLYAQRFEDVEKN